MRLLILLLCVLVSPLALAVPDTRPVDLLVRNARIIDGTGNPWFRGDVAVRGDRIVAVGDLGDLPARRVIDAGGKVVAPGFIDVHTHADEGLIANPAAENFLRNGVTTLVTGNCGYGVSGVAKYFRTLEKNGVALNVATLIGHNSVLRAVKGNKAGELDESQLARAKEIVRTAMNDGAMGLSTGLIYTPGTWSSTEEIIQLAKVAGEFGGIYATHMRSESTAIIKAIDEALRVGKEGGVRVQISHFKLPTDVSATIGGSDTTLARVIAARDAGQEVWLDQYPYTASSTSISTLLPDWVLAPGPEESRRILADPAQRPRILADMRKAHEVERKRTSLAFVVIASFGPDKSLAGQNILQITRNRKIAATTPDLLRDKGTATQPAEVAVSMEEQYAVVIQMQLAGGASAVFHSMGEPDVQNILRHPLVAVASDSGVRTPGEGQPHPRGYGTNSRVLGRYVRELRIITLEDAVRKMTSMPATAFRLSGRGIIREGNYADLVIFDPATVADTATFDKPHAFPVGISTVIVNGVVVVDEAKMTAALPGRPIRRGDK